MKQTLKLLTLFTSFCGLLLTASCNKEKDNEIPTSWFNGTITAIVENGNDYNSIISKVMTLVGECIIIRVDADDPGTVECTEMIFANYSNGGFTLTLPAIVDDKYLRFFRFLDISSSLTISDPNAKLFEMYSINAYDSNDVRIGDFSYIKQDEKSYTAGFFWYADRDFTITGSLFLDEEGCYFVEEGGIPLIWSVSLKKGWNRVYEIMYENKAEISTKAVSGMKWYFESCRIVILDPVEQRMRLSR